MFILLLSFCLEQDEGVGASVFNEGGFFWWEWPWERGPGIKVSISERLGPKGGAASGEVQGVPEVSEEMIRNLCAKYINT